MEPRRFLRISRLLGEQKVQSLSERFVVIVGVGAVGSYCTEALARSGVGRFRLVDFDTVGLTNVNRQLMATTKTVGQPKVEALKARLKEINPDAEIEAIQQVYEDESYQDWHLEQYDYIIDAIDSLKDKISLLLRASQYKAKIYSSMGAALKVDPTKIKVAEFWDVRGCPLGSIIRKRMRQAKTFPHKNIYCVYDDEVLENKGEAPAPADDNPMESKKAVTNGTTGHITAIFGMTLAGLVIKDIQDKL